jgi:HSP20 family protein
MPFRRYPFGSVWKEFDEMMTEMENRFSSMLEGMGTDRFLPAPGYRERMVPAFRGEFSVDVREHENEVILVADLPGIAKEDITVALIDPRTLEISTERKDEREEKEEGYFMRERLYGAMRRRILLPADVTEEGSQSSFNNGVLEVRLKKIEIPKERRIPIE